MKRPREAKSIEMEVYSWKLITLFSGFDNGPRTMLWIVFDVRFMFTIEMSCEKLLHVRFCGDAADNYGSFLVSRECYLGGDCRGDWLMAVVTRQGDQFEIIITSLDYLKVDLMSKCVQRDSNIFEHFQPPTTFTIAEKCKKSEYHCKRR